jgi:hypothetical protein
MNYRAVAVAFISISIVAIGVASFSRLASRKRLTQNEQPTQPTLEWRAQQAAKEGKDHVFLNASINDYALPRSLEGALEVYDVVLAVPVKKQSFAADDHESITTWYQFRVLDYLHHRTISDCRTCPAALTPPADMLPIDADQILVPQDGGDLTINGISFSSADPRFHGFEMDRKYVLFLIIDGTKRVRTVLAGPSGVYTLDSNNLLQPFSAASSPLSQEIQKKFNNSLAGLTDYLRSKRDHRELTSR